MLHNARLGVGCTIKHHDGPALCGEPADGGGTQISRKKALRNAWMPYCSCIYNMNSTDVKSLSFRE